MPHDLAGAVAPPLTAWPVRVPVLALLLLLVLPWAGWTPVSGGSAGTDTGLAAWAVPGPYGVETREVVIPRESDAADTFPAVLYLPSAPQADGSTGEIGWRSPVVAFGHGYLAPVELYASTLQHLASWGLTVVAPRSGGELFPDHVRFARNLSTAIEWVANQAEDDDWRGPPVDGAARGVSGHSMGGGAALLAAVADERIRAVATLAAADTRPSSIEAAAGLRIPALFIAASEDGITPVALHQRPMFGAVRGAPAQLRVVEGGSHCGFLDRVILAGVVCDRATLDARQQRALAQASLTAWLRSELAGDEAAAALAWPEAPLEGISLEERG